MDGKLLTGVALSAALELTGHWFPWPKPLHKVGAYIYGTLAILAGILVATERKSTGKAFLVCIGAGSATIAAYIVDLHLHTRQRRRYGRIS